jgi:hypothetical protein
MKKRVLFAGLITWICALANLCAEEITIASSPVCDGVINADEYPFSTHVSRMHLVAGLSPDGTTLTIGLEAQTSGWVSVGLGSLRMHDAYIVIGYDDNGIISIKEQKGSGHAHKENKTAILTASAVKEVAGVTTLEFSVPSTGLLEGTSLKTIIAYGKKDDFSSMHTLFAKVFITFKPR